MKKFLYKVLSFITFILAILCFVAMGMVKGDGFIDVSNLVRYGLALLATVFAIISVVIAIKLKLEKRNEEKNKSKDK